MGEDGHAAEDGGEGLERVGETQQDHAVMGADVARRDVLEYRVGQPR